MFTACCKSWNAVCADGVTVGIVLLAEINVGMMSFTVFCHICTFLCDIWVYTSSTWYPSYNTSWIHGPVNRITHNTIISDNTSHTSVPSLIFSAMIMVLHCREQFAMMQNILASFELSWYFGISAAVMYIVWIWTTTTKCFMYKLCKTKRCDFAPEKLPWCEKQWLKLLDVVMPFVSIHIHR